MTNKPTNTHGQFTAVSDRKTADSSKLIDSIATALFEKKGKDIKLLDVRELTTLTDYFIVCHGTSDTQIRALASSVTVKTKEDLEEAVWQQEGMDNRNWIILDYVNVVVHIFNQETRDFYGIERMWNDAVVTDLKDE